MNNLQSISTEKELLCHLVQRYNHFHSSSLAQDQFIQVLRTMRYVLNHGKKTAPLSERFAQGEMALYRLRTQLSLQYQQLIKEQLPFTNFAYEDTLFHQIPRYLALLESPDELFHYAGTEEDFDYPLLDGLALYHEMYHKAGIELLAEYLNRLAKEQQFCFYFKEEIKELLVRYEAKMKVSTEDLGVNLCKLLLEQFLYALLLGRSSILFTQIDADCLLGYLSSTSSDRVTETAWKRLKEALKEEALYQYLSVYQTEFTQKLNLWKETGCELLLLPVKNRTSLHLKQAMSNDQFRLYLTQLRQIKEDSRQSIILSKSGLSVYDLLDALEEVSWSTTVYKQFFESISVQETAVLIRIIAPSLFAFHETPELGETLYQELSSAYPFGSAMASVIMESDEERRKALHTELVLLAEMDEVL